MEELHKGGGSHFTETETRVLEG